MSFVRGKTILVGVSGGIAAYKTCALVSKLVQNGAEVHVMMTHNATKFVAPLTFETLSHNRVTVDTFDRDFTWEVEHVSLAKKADAAVLAPATADIIAKIACGIADDFFTTTVLACKCPILFAPAMNTAMMENPVTVSNIDKLVSRGFIPVYGGEGYLACGDAGKGRMAEADELFAATEKLFTVKNDFRGKTVLVTAGATRADIDPVRFISNRSSGKMGYNIAIAAYERGANVIYIRGFTDDGFYIPETWTVRTAETTSRLFDEVKKFADKADIAIMAAAPCDYAIEPSHEKIKSESVTLQLKKTTDIAAWYGKHKRGKLVIFAAETNDGEHNARAKLTAKNADMAVLNDITLPGAGFDVDTNIVTIITPNMSKKLPLMKKREVADAILDSLTDI